MSRIAIYSFTTLIILLIPYSGQAQEKTLSDAKKAFDNGQLEEALDVYSMIYKKDSTYIPSILGISKVYTQMNKVDQALLWTDKAIQLDSASSTLLYEKALIYIKNAYYESALLCLDQSLEISPDNSQYLSEKANCLQIVGRHDQAALVYKQIMDLISMNSKLSVADFDDLLLKYGVSLLATNQISLSLKIFEEAKESTNNQASLYFHMGTAYALDNNIELGILHFDKAIEKKKNFLEAYIQRAAYNQILNNYKASIADYSYLLKNTQASSAVYSARGYCQHQLGKFKQALSDYDKALAIDTFDQSTLIRRGYAHLKSEHYQLALQDFTKAIQTEGPFTPFALNNRGETYLALNKTDLAMNDIQSSIALDSTNLFAYINLAKTHDKLSEWSEAEKIFENLLQDNAENPIVIWAYAKSCYQNKKFSRTLKLISDLKNTPNSINKKELADMENKCKKQL